MAQTDWRLEGDWIKNCSCAYGCPCDFNAPPTHGWCKGLVGMRVVRGHFGGVSLDGVTFAATVDFPGPLHEGNGQMQPIIDEGATPEQRQALFEIFSGKHSAEGTLFHILSLIVTKIHEPIFASIAFDFDKEARKARLVAGDALETRVEPIKNPVSGLPHRISITMPEGFEHFAAEVASATISSTGALKFATNNSHSSLAHVVQTPQGLAA
jgi:hypothetical protein